VSTTPAIPVANFPPMSLVAVVYLDLRISEIYEKIETTLMLFSEAWEMMIHEKPEPKNLVTLSFKRMSSK
jgi:hypothetical protein